MSEAPRGNDPVGELVGQILRTFGSFFRWGLQVPVEIADAARVLLEARVAGQGAVERGKSFETNFNEASSETPEQPGDNPSHS